jgi:phage-related protein
VKPVEFMGDSLARVRDFPPTARRAAGYQLDRVQRGLEPDDCKPMRAVGRAFANSACVTALARSA